MHLTSCCKTAMMEIDHATKQSCSIEEKALLVCGEYDNLSEMTGKVQMLIDTGACVTMPPLISSRALNYLCPGIRLDPPPVDNPMANVNLANGSSMNILGTLDVRILLSSNRV